MERAWWPSAQLLSLLCEDLPDCFCQKSPHVPWVLSWLSFYLFGQALFFTLVFANGLLAALSTKVVTYLVGDGVQPPGAMEILRDPLRGFAFVYIYYGVFRVIEMFAMSTWATMWEMAHDFPTVRRIMSGRLAAETGSDTGGGAAPGDRDVGLGVAMRFTGVVSSPVQELHTESKAPWQRQSGGPSSPRKRSRAGGRGCGPRRWIVIVAPWVFVTLVSIVMLSSMGYCEGWTAGAGQDFVCAFSDPEARLNRNLRLASCLLLLQLMLCWISLFPCWRGALLRAQPGVCKVISVGALSILSPATVLAAFVWLAVPTGIFEAERLDLPAWLLHALTKKSQLVCACALQIGWGLWILLTTFLVTRDPHIQHTGFDIVALVEEELWARRAARLKLMIWVAQFLLVVRSGVAEGVAHAQNDLVSFTVLYPMLFNLMWTVTFVFVRLSAHARSRLHGLLIFVGTTGLVLLARSLCAYASAESAQLPVLVFFVWLSIAGEGLRIIRRWSNLAESVHASMAEGTTLKLAVTSQSTGTLVMRVTYFVFRLFCLASLSFVSVLGLCALAGTVQHSTGLIVSDIVWWHTVPGGITINNAGASVLKLRWRSSDSVNPEWSQSHPHDYMICGKTWYGLQLLDYALLSELPYVKPTAENDLPRLLKLLFGHVNISIVRASSRIGQRPWMEFEFRDPQVQSAKPISIVAIGGTVVDRVVDYLEDIRMWTDPVVLTILYTVLPLTRMWSRETTALFIGSLHRLMASVGVRDDGWHYEEILEHIRALAAAGEREVVVTGHSLGGGIALVIGALSGQTAVAIQPPGVYHSLAKHQAVQKGEHEAEGGSALHKRSLSLIFEGDWIQHFDDHGGLVQTMSCDQKGKSLAAGCHLLEGAIYHLIRHCGDSANRFGAVSHEYDLTGAGIKLFKACMEILRQGWKTSRWLERPGQARSIVFAGVAVSLLAAFRYGVPFYHPVRAAGNTKAHAE